VIQSGFQKVSQLETKVFKVTSKVQSLARAALTKSGAGV
jgi:hypothetical protein